MAYMLEPVWPFVTLQGALKGAGRGHQLFFLFEAPRLAAGPWCLSAHF
jgi:hypothetical protein